MASIYRSSDGEKAIQAIYSKAAKRLAFPCEDRFINTRFGTTHLLVAGPRTASPLVIVHGGNAPNPLSLSWFEPLVHEYRVYAPDLIGHPGRSAQTRISPSDTNHGHWFTDVLDGLRLTSAAAIGVSYGGGVLLQAATIAPRRITKAVLLAPAGIVPVSKVTLLLQLLPAMLVFKLFPNRERLVRAIRPLFMSEPEPLWVEAMGEIYKEVRLEHRMPRLVAPDELVGFTAPTLVVAGEKDVIFPAQALVERARQVIPNVVATDVLAGSGHVLSKEAIAPLNFRIRRFLQHGL